MDHDHFVQLRHSSCLPRWKRMDTVIPTAGVSAVVHARLPWGTFLDGLGRPLCSNTIPVRHSHCSKEAAPIVHAELIQHRFTYAGRSEGHGHRRRKGDLTDIWRAQSPCPGIRSLERDRICSDWICTPCGFSSILRFPLDIWKALAYPIFLRSVLAPSTSEPGD